MRPLQSPAFYEKAKHWIWYVTMTGGWWWAGPVINLWRGDCPQLDHPVEHEDGWC